MASDTQLPDPDDGVIVGGDGYASHAGCDPDDAVGDLSGPDGVDCWICGEELPAALPSR